MSRSQLLYDLQRTDVELEGVARRLKEIAAGLGEDAVLKRARQQLADAEAHLHKCRTSAKDLDLEVRSLGQRIQAKEQKLYGGQVTNPKELSSLQDDTASLQRYRAKKEEAQLEAMLGEEEAEASLAMARAALTQATEGWQAQQAQLLAEQAQLQNQQQGLNEQRAFLVTAIPADDLATYDRLRTRKAGRAVAAVKNGVCQGCHMSPPLSQVQQAGAGPELVFCSNCGRILHVT
jgi:predicted  nucleic acid-binding Zn-ribbon protein